MMRFSTMAAVALGTFVASAPALALAAQGSGWYRATVTFKDKRQVPFFIQVPEGASEGKLINGEEQLPLGIRRSKDKLTLLPRQVYETRIDVKANPDGSLEGKWNRYTPFWGQIVLPFKATPIDAPDPQLRFPQPSGKKSAVTADYSGTWKLKLDKLGLGIAKLQQTPDGIVTGYFQVKHYGDFQHMAGNVRDGKLYLSTFDGSNVALHFGAELTKDKKRLKGRYNIADVWLEDFTAVRDDAFVLENEVRLKPGVKKLDVPALEKYAGKPVVLFMFATWCPACNDAQDTLKDIYQRMHKKGLEVVAVSYDLEEDQKINREKAEEFKKLHALPWPIETIPGTPETFGELEPFPDLDGMEALPVAVFVRPDGTVAGLHGGFSGPATGEDYQKVRAKFHRLAEEITSAPR